MSAVDLEPRKPVRDAARTPAHFEPHIQGLRAIAVLLVVLYHFWPGRLSGGYIGVDIFFVISGFLITGQLVREISATGRVRLGRFWAKRARRLLPASVLVLVFSALMAILFLPVSMLPDSVRELLASTFYVENWVLALNAVDYLSTTDPSIVQHYWSLSLEEQFYVIWPLLLIAAGWLGVKLFKGDRKRGLLIVVAVATAASFAASVILTGVNGSQAYFVTHTRVWEFGVGALIALLPWLRPKAGWSNALFGYAGLILILASAWEFDRNTAFPGYMAALPVIGTALVIVSARNARFYDAGKLLSIRPMRFIGDISYSLYLWHWPLIVVQPYLPGWGLEWYNRVALLVLCFVLAWLTKRFVEDPARDWKRFTEARPRRTAIAAVGLMAISSLLVAGLWAVRTPQYEQEAAQLLQTLENPPECFGALAGTAGDPCLNGELEGVIIPSPGFANADKPRLPECLTTLNESQVNSCTFGSDDPDAPRIALIGDSHAYQMIDVMAALAEEQGWALTTYMKGGCAWNTQPLAARTTFTASCDAYQLNLREELASVDAFDVIVTSALGKTAYQLEDGDIQTAVDGYIEAWQGAQGAYIVAIADNPAWEEDPNKCLRIEGDPAACAIDRDEALPEVDALAEAALQYDAGLIDLRDVYCDEDVCSPVVGGANVYRDQDHLTNTFVFTMKSFLVEAVDAGLSR